MILWLVAIGLVSILGQVTLLRELNVAFYGSELIYILALGVWMFWTAAGAALGRRAARPSAHGVRILLLAHAWVLPAALVLTRDLRHLFGGVRGAYLPFPRQLLAMVLILLPVGLSLGLLFQWAAKLYVDRRRTLAGAYALESLGGVAGGILATLFLGWRVNNLLAALLCAMACLLFACHPWRRGRPRWILPVAVTMLLPLVVCAAWSNSLDRALTARNHPFLLESRDSPYGRITLARSGDQISVFQNDALAFESEGTAAEEFVHLAALQHPRPRSVLVLGGGVEGLVREILLHDPRSVDYVELNPVLLDLAGSHLTGSLRAAMDDERVEVTVDDPVRFLRGGKRYDLILVGMPEPESGQTNRFYTSQFFARCAAHLEPAGVLAFRLRGAENLWTPQQSRRAASIHGALSETFSDVVVLPGVTNVFLASRVALPRDPAVLGRRLQARGVEPRLVIPAYIEYLYTNDRFAAIARILETTEAPINSDTRPICYQYTLLLWLSRFFPSAASFEVPDLAPGSMIRSWPVWIIAAGLAAAALVARFRPTLRRALLAGVAGFIGMVLETVLILNYQTHQGVLYRDLGLLLTLFMAGLALGAMVVDRGSRATGTRRGLSPLAGGLLLGALASLAILVALLLGRGLARGPFATAVLLFVAGALVAALFAHASLVRSPDQRRVVAPLYSADLLGGSLGSLVASLLLIPAMGLAGAGAVAAATALLAFLLL